MIGNKILNRKSTLWYVITRGSKKGKGKTNEIVEGREAEPLEYGIYKICRRVKQYILFYYLMGFWKTCFYWC